MQEITHGNQSKFSCYEQKNIKDPTTSLLYSQIFTLEKVDGEYWGGTWYDFSISDPYVDKSLYRGEKIKGAC